MTRRQQKIDDARLDEALADTFPASDPVGFLEPSPPQPARPKRRADIRSIDTGDSQEVRFWAKELGVEVADIVRAVDAVGADVAKARAYLAKARRRGIGMRDDDVGPSGKDASTAAKTAYALLLTWTLPQDAHATLEKLRYYITAQSWPRYRSTNGLIQKTWLSSIEPSQFAAFYLWQTDAARENEIQHMHRVREITGVDATILKWDVEAIQEGQHDDDDILLVGRAWARR